MFLKGIGCILIVGCTGGIGGMASVRLCRRVSQLEQFEDFLRCIQRELNYSLKPVNQLLENLSNWGEFCRMPILQAYYAFREEDTPFPERWRKATKKARIEVKPEERELMASLSDILGAFDYQSQIEGIEALHSRIESRLEEAKKEKEKRTHLYNTLGVLSGIGICIMML